MSEEENEVEEERQQPDRVVEHRIIKMEEKPPKSKKTENLQNQLDERDAQMITLISHNLDLEKSMAKDKFPDESFRIEGAKNHLDLEQLLEQLDENYQPPKPRGKATLPNYQKGEGLGEAESHGSLIEKLYKTRMKPKDPNQIKAREMVEKLNRTIGQKITGRQIIDSMPAVGFACVRCHGWIMGKAHSGDECPHCHHLIGEPIMREKVVNNTQFDKGDLW